MRVEPVFDSQTTRGRIRLTRATPPKISPRQAIALTLSRQYLVEPAARPMDAVRRLVVVQAQYAASVPLAIRARCPSVPQGWAEQALARSRRLVKTWSVRGTVHASAAADLPLLTQAIGATRRLRLERMLHDSGVLAGRLHQVNAAILRALAGGPRTRADLHRTVPALAGVPGKAWGVDVKCLAYAGELVFADSEAGAVRFARRDRWLHGLEWRLPDAAAAQRELLLRYFAAFAPATIADFVHWSGLPMKAALALHAACAPALAPVVVDGWRGEHYVRRADLAAARRADPPLPAIALLPKFDALVMGWRTKTRFLDAVHLAQVYRPAAQVEAVLLLDGRGAATWRLRQSARRLALDVFPFRTLGAAERRRLAAAAEDLAGFRGADAVEVCIGP
jgi:hypothetical protein